jgi:hypothetical protein
MDNTNVPANWLESHAVHHLHMEGILYDQATQCRQLLVRQVAEGIISGAVSALAVCHFHVVRYQQLHAFPVAPMLHEIEFVFTAASYCTGAQLRHSLHPLLP